MATRSMILIGFAAAVLFLVLAWLLLPREEATRARQPLIFLVLALIFGVLAFIVPDSAATVNKVLVFVYTFFLLASLGRSLVLLAVDVVAGRRMHRAPPRIFRDLTQAVVYVVVLMFTLRAVGVEPGSILTTSALLTAVVGLALQDTLGNMVSGLALQMQRPFEVGDWIQFESDPRQIGRVTETNWRATTVLTNDLVEVIVPNALLAKQPIRNYSQPSRVSRRIVTVHAAYGIPPRRVHHAILGAVRGTPGVLVDPAPSVQTRSFADSGIEYAVLFFVDDFAERDRIDAEVRDRIWYALQRASVEIPFPTRILHLHQASEESEAKARERELARRDRVLRCVDFLDVLPAQAHRALAEAAEVRLYAPGETIVLQGDASSELFVVSKGEVVVELPREGGAVQVARLAAGKFFGEMGLMTGEPRTASVRAVSECEIIVIGHEAFHAALLTEGSLVEKISDLLATRQQELDAVASSSREPTTEPIQERSKRLISQIKDFFKL